MMSNQNLDRLLEWEPKPDSRILSIYLTTDPSEANNLKRGFKTVLEDMLRGIEAELTDPLLRSRFDEDAARVKEIIENHTPREKSLVMFSDASEQFFWVQDLRIRMHNEARWDERPYVRPLLEALDEHERYGVVLTEHGRSRLFTVFIADIEEHVDAFTSAKVRHLTSTGTDHLLSQKQFQRKSEIHALWHLKHAAELLDHLVAQYAFDRLVLAGPEEPVTELARLLPKRLRTRVVARIAVPFSASADQVLKATHDVVERVECEAELRLVEELLEDAGARRGAVTGLDETLLATQERRVYRLIYVEGFRKTGWRCDRCHALCAETCQVCPYCEGSLSRIEDLIDELARQIVDSGGKAEVVSGEAARILSSAGSIGAQLRY